MDDLAAAERFYVEVLGLEVEARFPDRGLALRCDSGVLLLFDPKVTRIRDSPLPAHGTVGAGHIAFLATEEELPGWRAQLAAHGVAVEETIAWEQGGTSLYFRDPAGNSLELAPPTLWSWRSRSAPRAAEEDR